MTHSALNLTSNVKTSEDLFTTRRGEGAVVSCMLISHARSRVDVGMADANQQELVVAVLMMDRPVGIALADPGGTHLLCVHQGHFIAGPLTLFGCLGGTVLRKRTHLEITTLQVPIQLPTLACRI